MERAALGGTILFVCEGNVCRSAFAQVILAHRLTHLGIHVASAGTGALVDSELDPDARRLARALIGEVEPFRARQLTPELIGGADLVLTATRWQRDKVAVLNPRALSRVFALRDFAALLVQWDGVQDGASGEASSLIAQLVQIARAQRGTAPMLEAAEVDIGDPYRRGAAAFQRMQDEMLPSLERIEGALIALKGMRPDPVGRQEEGP
ncbi:arsenate reductase/protein-tyrosine-phosphatase family protein [Nostocoides australiense]